MTEIIVRHSMGGSAVQKSKIIVGDCLDKMREMETNSVDSIVTDPPYGLSNEPDIAEVLTKWVAGEDYQHRGGGFMGKSWDSFVPGPSVWREALRVLKPGGHMLAFFGSRTYDLGVLAIRLAGFEIRDQIMWLYGSGFPKSKNLDGDWQGWGTALKPAHEPICVARKPLSGTVAANVLKWGTGVINVDGCRVGTEVGTSMEGVPVDNLGRWPANVIHDGSPEVVACFPQSNGQQGNLRGHNRNRKSPNGCFGQMGPAKDHPARGDTGSAARFFYCAKASKKDRDEGCENLPLKRTAKLGGSDNDRTDLDPVSERFRTSPSRNTHPTVKPTDLMRYLCRLVTPPGGTVLDPFAGSGSTGKAAVLEGFRFIGIELSEEYAVIGEARIADASNVMKITAKEEKQLSLL